MVVDHDEPPPVSSDAMNTPVGIASVDLTPPMSRPQSRLDLEPEQTTLGKSPLRVRGPFDLLDHSQLRDRDKPILPPQPARSTSSMR
jgi:hypothetical protein